MSISKAVKFLISYLQNTKDNNYLQFQNVNIAFEIHMENIDYLSLGFFQAVFDRLMKSVSDLKLFAWKMNFLHVISQTKHTLNTD